MTRALLESRLGPQLVPVIDTGERRQDHARTDVEGERKSIRYELALVQVAGESAPRWIAVAATSNPTPSR